MTVAKKAPSPDLIDQLLADYRKPEDLIGEHGLLKQITKAVVERALLGMTNMSPSPMPQATPATAPAARRSRANSANCR